MISKTKALGKSMCGFLTVCLIYGLQGIATAKPLTPPPTPSVRPFIAKEYSTDANSDRIEDHLVDRATEAETSLKAASTAVEKTKAQAASDHLVDVELVFSEQITQPQIDAFVKHGGKISYIYQAISFGWNGQIPLGKVKAIPAVLGDKLVLVKESRPMRWHVDTSTKTGRVRPVWATGFAGSATGFSGSTNITIAIADTGVDGSHSDLNGRGVYWQDFTTDASATPVDVLQHGSHVTGIALGSGASAGAAVGPFSFSDEDDLTGVPSGSFYPSPFELPASASPVTVTITALWNGGGSGNLRLVYHSKGTSSGYSTQATVTNVSPLTLTVTFTPDASRIYSPALLSNGSMSNYTVHTEISNYPASDDGFNKLRGVAPDCNWAVAKVFSNAGDGLNSWGDAGVDDLVANRVAKKIKVLNLSLGTIGDPGLDPTERQKINSAVNNGIVVVVSAGNDGQGTSASKREIDDPGRAAMALTVAAANEVNQLTDYTSQGFSAPSTTTGQEEDYKPDLMAPGGSANYYSGILSVDSNWADGAFADQVTNDYLNIQGTSMASPFAAGCAALVIDALERNGTTWDFSSSTHSCLVKMLLCATSSESNTNREGGANSPTLQRAAAGPNSFPAGKDKFEGYGMINPDAAIEAVSQTYAVGSTATNTLGPTVTDRRVWARKVNLIAGQAFNPSLTNPVTGDFDFYLYRGTPSVFGTPVILASSTQAGNGSSETFSYTSSSNATAFLVVKRISGSGMFTVTSPGLASPPAVSGIEGSPLAFTENQSPALITSSLIVTDSDSVNLSSATVRIITNFVTGQDVLAMSPNPQNGISASYASGTGILTLSGSSSVANYQTALRSVTYSNSSEAPSTATRFVSFKVNDGAADSNTQTRNINVTAVNDPPVLAAIADRIINEGVTLILTNVATDPDSLPSQLTFSISNAPVGMSINATNGILTWTPSELQGPSTISNIAVTVTDSGALSDTKTFSVVVNEVNAAPTLAAITNYIVAEGATLTFTNIATDADVPANTLTFSLEPGAPSGASVNPTNGVFTWTPDETQGPSTNNITVRVTDNGSPSSSDTKTFSVTVNEVNVAPVLSAITNRVVDEGVMLAITNVVTDSDVPANTISYSLGVGAPTGVAIDSGTGVFTWTPAENQGPGVYSITVIATDNGSPVLSSSNSFSVTVNEVNIAPTLTANSNQVVNEEVTLTITNVATDPDIPANMITYSLGVGAPSGAAIAPATGVFTWTPTESQGPGVYSITVIATDNGSPVLSSSNSFSVTVNEVNVAPTLNAITNQIVNEGVTLTVTNVASDPDIPANTITYSLDTNAPAGAAIDSGTGVFTWTPTESQGPGVYSITVIATDNGSPVLSSSNSFSVTVDEANFAPVLAAISTRTVHTGSLVLITNTATDADVPTNILTFSLTNAPAGMSIDPSTGIATWTPTDANTDSTNTFTVQVTDDGSPNLSDSKTGTIIVMGRPIFLTTTTSNSIVTLTWTSIPQQSYRVQYKNDLSEADWTNLGSDVQASGSTASTTDSLGTSERFYRIVLP